MSETRFTKMKEELERLSDEKEKAIAGRYATLLKDIKDLVDVQYEQYEEDGSLTYEEMVKFDRLKKLESSIIEAINDQDRAMRNEIRAHLKGQYTEAYYQTAFILETEAKARLSYAKVEEETILDALNNDFTGLTLNERLSKRRRDLILNMRASIVKGLHDGASYRTMVKAIKGELENDLVKAQRIVRTESKRLRESGKLKSVKHAAEKGVIMTKTWKTVQDSRVRDRHRRLNGETVPGVDGVFEVAGREAEAPGQFGRASLDVNCRCYLTYEIQEVNKKQYDELADLEYQEWQKQRLA